MKKRQGKRHSPEQIIRKLREAEAMLAVSKTIGQVVQALPGSVECYRLRTVQVMIPVHYSATWRTMSAT